MSSYLQRLVDTAAGRGDAVHPRTGSIFSPRLEERPAPLQGWEETEHVTLAQPPLHQPHATPPEREPPEPPRGVRPGSEHAPLLPKSVAPDRRAAADAPPFVPAMSDPVGSPDDPFGDRSSRPAAEAQRPLLTAEADVHVTVPAPASGRAGDPFRPVMQPTRVSDAVVSATGPGDRPRPRHGAQAAQQPDDIQIHIGRIEVLAVPPPAPRAPKAPDRSLSLDAYLNRRDGRTR
jgi:hypothetical protein